MFSLSRLRITTQFRFGTVDKIKWPVLLQNASGNPIHSTSIMTQISPRISTNKGEASEVKWWRSRLYKQLALFWRNHNFTTAIVSERPQFFFEINESWIEGKNQKSKSQG